MRTIIITNNKKVNIDYSNRYEVQLYPDDSQLDILIKARNYIHLGGKLLIHPMLGRVKTHETPYKSIVMEIGGKELSVDSLLMIEDSIQITEKFLNDTVYVKYYDELLPELQLIDAVLVSNGIEELER